MRTTLVTAQGARRTVQEVLTALGEGCTARHLDLSDDTAEYVAATCGSDTDSLPSRAELDAAVAALERLRIAKAARRQVQGFDSLSEELSTFQLPSELGVLLRDGGKYLNARRVLLDLVDTLESYALVGFPEVSISSLLLLLCSERGGLSRPSRLAVGGGKPKRTFMDWRGRRSSSPV